MFINASGLVIFRRGNNFEEMLVDRLTYLTQDIKNKININ